MASSIITNADQHHADEEVVANNENNSFLLAYPYNFFHEVTGFGPKTEQEAECYWQFRKSRPRDAMAIDTVPPNGALMLKEIQSIRTSLRKHIEYMFMEEVRQKAREAELQTPLSNDPIVSKKDIINFLKSLKESSQENQQMVYTLVHEFHKTRQWQADAIDKWFAKNNMKLIPAPDEKKQRKHGTDRGGFSVVAREAKSQAVQSLMQPMLSKVGWCISLINNVKSNQNKTYTAVTKLVNGKEQLLYYLVKMNEEASSKEPPSTKSLKKQTSYAIDNLFNFNLLATMMTNMTGVEVSVTQAKDLFCNTITVTEKENHTGKTMTFSTMNDENASTTLTSEHSFTSEHKTPVDETSMMNRPQEERNDASYHTITSQDDNSDETALQLAEDALNVTFSDSLTTEETQVIDAGDVSFGKECILSVTSL